jgi:hypothetical protein
VDVAAGLGAHRSTHRGRFRVSVMAVIVLTIGFVAGPVVLGGIDDATTIGLLLLLSLPMVGFAAWLGWWEYHHSDDRVDLYEHGFVHHDRRGVAHAYPWAGVERVRERTIQASVGAVPVRTVHFAEIRHADGARVVLNNRFRGIAGLRETIVKEASWAILARASDALHAGQPQEFDGTILDLHGIRRGRRHIPWEDVKELTVFNGVVFGKIRVKQKSRRLATTWRVFPAPIWSNLRVLFALAHSRMARYTT